MLASYIDRTASAVVRDAMYDVLHGGGPTSGRRVGLGRRVRWFGADVGPTLAPDVICEYAALFPRLLLRT